MAEKTLNGTTFEVDDTLFERFERVSNGMEGKLTDDAQLKLLAECEDDFDRLALFNYLRVWLEKPVPETSFVARACRSKKAFKDASSAVNRAMNPTRARSF